MQLRDGERAIDGHDRLARQMMQRVVELHDGFPISDAATAAVDVSRLQRGLELKATDRRAGGCSGCDEVTGSPQQRFGFVDHLSIPQHRILLGEGNVLTELVAPGAAARISMKHQRQEARSLRLIRQQLRHEPPQKQRLA